MTQDERIEAMARAICEQFYGTGWELTSHFRQQICIGLADKALAAAGVEEMVREAAQLARDFDAEPIDAIVSRVMGQGLDK